MGQQQDLLLFTGQLNHFIDQSIHSISIGVAFNVLCSYISIEFTSCS